MFKTIITLVLSLACFAGQAQFGILNTNFGRTTTSIRTIGIGTFANTGDFRARLHVNNFLMNNPADPNFNGFLFRTDGDQSIDNRWSIWTGSSATSQTERFRIRTIGNGFDTWIERTQLGSEADLRLLTAEVQIRARNKRLADFCELAGALADEVIIGDGSDVNFSSLSLSGRRLFVHGLNGFVGLGSSFRESGGAFLNPNYQLHLNDSTIGAIFMQVTNDNSGFTANDGVRLGITNAGNVELRNYEDSFLDFAQNNSVRQRFRNLATITMLNGTVYNNCNRIMIPLRNNDIAQIPISLMQLGTSLDGNVTRSWMNIGTTYGGGEDAMYVGLLEGGTPGGVNQTDAVIAWGCQSGNAPGQNLNADNFRIIFLTPEGTQNPNVVGNSQTVQGEEVFRIEPRFRNVGIGNFSSNSANNPGSASYIGAKLDIDGDLRIRSVTQDNDLTRILVSDPNDLGRVHWRDISTITGACDWNLAGIDGLATGYAGACRPGNVSVGSDQPIADIKLFVYNAGQGEVNGVQTRVIGSGNNTEVTGVFGQAEGNSGQVTGVLGQVSNSGPNVTMFGVAGRTPCSNAASYAIFGSAGCSTGNNWAGFFNGRTFCTAGNWSGSDENLKTGISNLEGACELLQNVGIHTYEFTNSACEQLNLPSGTHFGVLAQELQEVMPSLVTDVAVPAEYNEDGEVVIPANNIKAVNYDEFIPILIKANQELTSQITSMQNQINQMQEIVNACCASAENTRSSLNPSESSADEIHLKSNESIILNQNVPNPLSERTEITYDIPQSFSKASIIFHDSNGKLINEYLITKGGKGSLIVYANDLSNGVYTYTLVVDGKLIDTKRMIKQ